MPPTPPQQPQGQRSLLITFDYPPIVGGIAHVLGRFWRISGHEGCTILAPSAAGDLDFDAEHPVCTLRFAAGGSGTLGKVFAFVAATWRACWWLVRNRPDFVIAGQLVRAGPICYMWHRLTGRPFDLWVYGGETDPRFTGSRWMTGHLHRILRSARRVFTNSPFTTQEMIDFGVDTETVVEVPLGVDRDIFRPQSPPDELVERYELRDRLVLLTVGRLVQRKGVDAALRTLHQLDGRLPPWRYVIVSDGPYRDQLEALSAELGLTDRVVFTGYVNEEDLPGLYNACDIFLMPNRQVAESTDSSLSVEGFGIVFLEAAACGKPVIAGRSGGAVHAVDDGISGLLVDADSGELGAALLELADGDRRSQMGEAGLRFAARFTWERSGQVLSQYL
jgi:phosphatidyl-myo-inositol dimannoside synthase